MSEIEEIKSKYLKENFKNINKENFDNYIRNIYILENNIDKIKEKLDSKKIDKEKELFINSYEILKKQLINLKREYEYYIILNNINSYNDFNKFIEYKTIDINIKYKEYVINYLNLLFNNNKDLELSKLLSIINDISFNDIKKPIIKRYNNDITSIAKSNTIINYKDGKNKYNQNIKLIEPIYDIEILNNNKNIKDCIYNEFTYILLFNKIDDFIFGEKEKKISDFINNLDLNKNNRIKNLNLKELNNNNYILNMIIDNSNGKNIFNSKLFLKNIFKNSLLEEGQFSKNKRIFRFSDDFNNETYIDTLFHDEFKIKRKKNISLATKFIKKDKSYVYYINNNEVTKDEYEKSYRK